MAFAQIRICDTCGGGSPPSVALPPRWTETGTGAEATHRCNGCNGGDAQIEQERAARLASLDDDQAEKLGFISAKHARALAAAPTPEQRDAIDKTYRDERDAKLAAEREAAAEQLAVADAAEEP